MALQGLLRSTQAQRLAQCAPLGVREPEAAGLRIPLLPAVLPTVEGGCTTPSRCRMPPLPAPPGDGSRCCHHE